MSPASQLATLLQYQREQGAAFDPAWTASWAHIDWPRNRVLRHEWEQSLQWAQAAFRDAYEHPQRRTALLIGEPHPEFVDEQEALMRAEAT